MIKQFIILIAKLHNWLAKKYIPKDTYYCYEMIRIDVREDGRPIPIQRTCPYHDSRKDPEPDEDDKPYYWQYCHYIQDDLSIQDMCKDCMINEPEE